MVLRSKLLLAVSVVGVVGLGFLWTRRGAEGRPFPNGTKVGVAGPVSVIAYSPEGAVLCASPSGFLQTYLPDKGRFRSFTVTPEVGDGQFGGQFGSSTRRLRFSKDGKQVFVGLPQRSGYVVVFDVEKRRSLYSFQGPLTNVFDVSPDEKWAACGVNGGIVLVDLKKPKPRRKTTVERPAAFKEYATRFYGAAATPGSAAFSPDSRTLAVGFGGQIALFDTDGDFQIPHLQCDMKGAAMPLELSARPGPGGEAFGFDMNPYWLEWSPDGTRLAALTNSEILIFNSNLQRIAASPLPPNRSQSNMMGDMSANIVWAPDGRRLFSGGGIVSSWSVPDLQLQTSYDVSGPVALSPNGKTLLTNSQGLPGDTPHLLQWNVG
ncbi:WD40 repeat domain-containing protein [bacterium]|nr:MAG: WD40 repeat domain-containing protein [bacterium]